MVWAFLATFFTVLCRITPRDRQGYSILYRMKSIREYLEYRDFLRDYYTEKKNESPFYSLRYMGGKVMVDPSHLVKIFQHRRHIGNSLIDMFIDHCGLAGADAEYFANLVRFNKAKSDREAKLYYEKLLALKGSGARSLEKSQYDFYTQWYHSAILTLLDFFPFDSATKGVMGFLKLFAS